MKDVIYEVYSNEEFNSVLDYLRENGIHIGDGNYDAYYCFNNEGDSYYVGTTNGNLTYNGTNCYKNTPLIKGFKKETMTQTPKTFAIKGSKSLLKAMEEELEKLGFYANVYSFIRGNGYEGGGHGLKITSNLKSAQNKEQYSQLCCSSVTADSYFDVTFQLPQQWDECLTFCKEQLELWDKPKYKVGDFLIAENAGGWGYRSDNNGCLVVVEAIGEREIQGKKVQSIDGKVLNPKVISSTVFRNVPIEDEDGLILRLATKEEIEKVIKIEVGGHTMEVVNGKFRFGCQYITKEEVEMLRKFVGSPLNFKMKVGDTEVNTELLNKILGKL